MVGTRPEAIKMSPVAAALVERGLNPTLLFTGQHPDVAPADYGFGHCPLIRLQCPGLADPAAHVGAVTKAVLPLVTQLQPGLVMVQGDTSSALGAALAAHLRGIPVAHVEAGLRSHSRRHPWPEEEFRIAIDRDSELLFAPTALSAANLRRERVRGHIHVTGNTAVDAVLGAAGTLRPNPDGMPSLLVTCHRRENWAAGVDQLGAALRAIAGQSVARVSLILHPNPALANRVREMLGGCEGVTLLPPCTHAAAVAAMLRATLVLSDSGGIQEEAAALGVPLLILRERSERPEAIACGNIELVGTDPGHIFDAVLRRLRDRRTAAPSLAFGDGRAGQRIAEHVDCWLGEKELPRGRQRRSA